MIESVVAAWYNVENMIILGGNDLIERYWALFTTMKYKEYYYQEYNNRAHRLNMLITLSCILAASLSAIFVKDVLFLTVLIAAAQILTSILPLLPYSQQVTAMKFLLPLLANMLSEMEYNWDEISRHSEERINRLMKKYRDNYASLLNQFVGTTQFPVSNKCEVSAEAKTKNYFERHFFVGGETHGK